MKMPSLQMLLRAWHADASRRVLWLAVVFMAGIASYYALPYEPAWYAFAIIMPLLLGWWAARRHGRKAVSRMVGLLILALLGAAWAKFMATQQATIMMEASPYPHSVQGTVEALEYLPTGMRITLKKVDIWRWPAEKTPYRVRLSIRVKKTPDIRVGNVVRLRAGLLPPMGPVLRGGFDFSRYFYFRGIGAVGYGLMPIRTIKEATPEGVRGFWEGVRHYLAQDIRRALPGETGAIATGLVTGDDAAISTRAHEALRAANLLHIIAISGAHMVVIGGVVFVSIRLLLLTAMRRYGLQPQAKQVAAGITLVAITAYLFVTGIELSALRAYIMMSLLLLSVLLLREVQPMRSLALTAFIMMLYDPSDVLEPGFQLSFIATMAMIAVVERQLKQTTAEAARKLRVLPFHAIGLFLLFSVSAEAATAPLVLSMFNQFAPYGVLANFIAGPIVSILIMPAVAVYFLLLPFGVGDIALWVMGQGIDAMLLLAEEVARWPSSLVFVPSPPFWAVAAYVFGVCWLCLWQQRWRWLGVVPVVAALASIPFTRIPDVIVSADARYLMFHAADGTPTLAWGRASSLVPKLIANGVGETALRGIKRREQPCNGHVCHYQTQHGVVTYERKESGAKDLCKEAATHGASLVVTQAKRLRCPKIFVIDAEGRAQNGAYTLYRSGDYWRIETTRDFQGVRPWSAVALE
jgi:competence protein ComEC